MRWLADLAYVLAGVVYAPVAVYHALALGKNRHGWGQRFGFLPQFAPDRRRIWIHAVSLGEINATPRLVEALQARLPDVEIVFSTTTDTGFARAVALYGTDRVFRFPLDFSPVIARTLRRIRPTMIVLVELEVWFNLVRMASRAGIPVAVINGRLTERSFGRLRRLGRVARAMFRELAWVGAQDETIARRFRELGVAADRIEVTSSLKWDTAHVTDRVEGSDALADTLGLDRSDSLWVCGSTGPGEEAMILEAYRTLLEDRTRTPAHETGGEAFRPVRLAIVPRKPERFSEVARLIESAGFACVRRSACPDGTSPGPLPDRAVILGDSMGELRKFYSLASVVFVGRSLVPLGGSDPMEVAALARPIVTGPHMDNFVLPVRALAEADAVRRVDSARALAETVSDLTTAPADAGAIGQRAREVVVRHQGATERTADRLAALLSAGGTGRGTAPRPPRPLTDAPTGSAA